MVSQERKAQPIHSALACQQDRFNDAHAARERVAHIAFPTSLFAPPFTVAKYTLAGTSSTSPVKLHLKLRVKLHLKPK